MLAGAMHSAEVEGEGEGEAEGEVAMFWAEEEGGWLPFTMSLMHETRITMSMTWLPTTTPMRPSSMVMRPRCPMLSRTTTKTTYRSDETSKGVYKEHK